VWFDRQRLEPGDEWELGIITALHACEAAVLLLTPEALASPWGTYSPSPSCLPSREGPCKSKTYRCLRQADWQFKQTNAQNLIKTRQSRRFPRS
jgi:hypothetical protein